MTVQGFLVAAWDERPRSDGRRRIFATGRLVDGRTFAIVLPAPPPAVYVAADAASRARAVLAGGFAAERDPIAWTSFEGRPLARIALGRRRPEDAERRLAGAGIHVHAIDHARAADTLLALGVRGPVITGWNVIDFEPLAARTAAPLDYAHYRDRQLVPIAAAIANVLDADVAGWFNEPGQLGLFALE